jgi:hypothetical protein
LMKTAMSIFEVGWRWCTGLQFLWVWLLSSQFIFNALMVSETWYFSHNFLF